MLESLFGGAPRGMGWVFGCYSSVAALAGTLPPFRASLGLTAGTLCVVQSSGGHGVPCCVVIVCRDVCRDVC